MRSTARDSRAHLAPPVGPLQLELRQGCRDRAVIGGIAPLLARWATQAAEAEPDPARGRRLRELVPRALSYPDLPRPERVALLEQALELTSEQPAPRPRRDARAAPARWTSPVGELRGVGERRAEALGELGVRTVGDLLCHFPSRYDDRRELAPVSSLTHRQTATVAVSVTGPGEIARKPGRLTVTVPATDGQTPVSLIWFNQPYRAGQFQVGTRLIVSGQALVHRSGVSLCVTELEVAGAHEALHSGRIVPLYPLTAGISQPMLRRVISSALEQLGEPPDGVVPATARKRLGLMELGAAVRAAHFPESLEVAERARQRLAFEELFLLQAALARRRGRVKRVQPETVVAADGVIEALSGSLPFTLTGAQERVIAEVLADLEQPLPAYRLVHGDVGSGKTVVAAAALLAAARAGRQGAMMAPTELLAEQHFDTLNRLLRPLGVEVVLLSGSLAAGQGARARALLASGRAPVAVGTHALFQQSVSFADLALAIIDEQHRFGVKQRAALTAKGTRPNVIVMSATPIPRTLALTAFGDFDISVLDELPPGRRPVHTEIIGRRERAVVTDMIIKLAERGQQAYIICPVIEERQNGAYIVASAEKQYERLSRYEMPTLRMGLIHGAMEPEARRRTMERFRDRKLDVLVATSMVEVGVDVPTATVMIVENAERFGLSQLHQLRGRVARACHPAFCFLATGSVNPEVIERLQVLVRTGDGFVIAKEDLRRRGPGEMAGIRQSGLPDRRMAALLEDIPALARAREEAFQILQADPELSCPEHAPLREALLRHEDDPWAL